MMKYLYYILLVMFFAFAAVQYNDSDALIWILLYAIPFYLVIEKLRGTNTSKKYFIIIGLIYFLWAIDIFPPQWEGVTLDEMGMKTLNIELARESLGLGLTAFIIWILALMK